MSGTTKKRHSITLGPSLRKSEDEKSPRNCDFCGAVGPTFPCTSHPVLPKITKTCKKCTTN